jgi:hypothetical protein
MVQKLPGNLAARRALDLALRRAAMNNQKMQTADQQAIASAQAAAVNAQSAAGAAQTDATLALARSPKFRLQVGTVNAIAVGASADVPIVWSTPFANANYDTDITNFTGLIGRATCVVKPGSKTAAGCTVTVTATLLVSLGSQFLIGAVLSN